MPKQKRGFHHRGRNISYRRIARTVWRGLDLGPGGFPGGVEGVGPPRVRGRTPAPRIRKFSIFLLKIDHSETSEFMILGSLHR